VCVCVCVCMCVCVCVFMRERSWPVLDANMYVNMSYG